MLAQGADVIDIGLASSDLLYYASGSRRLPAAMFTASHNPAEYNGIKLCHAGALPFDLDVIKPLTADALEGRGPAPAQRAGRRTEENLLDDFVDHVVSFIDVTSFVRAASSPTPPTGWVASSSPPSSIASGCSNSR